MPSFPSIIQSPSTYSRRWRTFIDLLSECNAATQYPFHIQNSHNRGSSQRYGWKWTGKTCSVVHTIGNMFQRRTFALFQPFLCRLRATGRRWYPRANIDAECCFIINKNRLHCYSRFLQNHYRVPCFLWTIQGEHFCRWLFIPGSQKFIIFHKRWRKNWISRRIGRYSECVENAWN